MNGQQSVVALGGLGLAAVNLWTGPQKDALGAAFVGGKKPAPAHSALLQLGGELLLVLVVTVVAGMSDSLGTGMLALIAALWVLWAIQYYSATAATPAKKTA